MRLSIQDRNEFMKAVTRAEDLKSLKQYMMALVDMIDDLPDGKSDAPVPRYVPPGANGHPQVPAPAANAANGRHQDDMLLTYWGRIIDA